MRRKLVILMAVLLFAVAAPVFAEEGHQHGISHLPMDVQCTKECAMLLKNCAQEVDSIQDRIRKLQVEIDNRGSNAYTLEELKLLHRKLEENNETLRALQTR